MPDKWHRGDHGHSQKTPGRPHYRTHYLFRRRAGERALEAGARAYLLRICFIRTAGHQFDRAAGRKNDVGGIGSRLGRTVREDG